MIGLGLIQVIHSVFVVAGFSISFDCFTVVLTLISKQLRCLCSRIRSTFTHSHSVSTLNVVSCYSLVSHIAVSVTVTSVNFFDITTIVCIRNTTTITVIPKLLKHLLVIIDTTYPEPSLVHRQLSSLLQQIRKNTFP